MSEMLKLIIFVEDKSLIEIRDEFEVAFLVL
jgi:hypothetical protein